MMVTRALFYTTRYMGINNCALITIEDGQLTTGIGGKTNGKIKSVYKKDR